MPIAGLPDCSTPEEGLRNVADLVGLPDPPDSPIPPIDPGLTTGLLLVPSDKFERGLVYAVEHGHLGVLPWEGDLGLDPAPLLQHATALGRQVGCYVVNDPMRMQQLAALGLWAFVTDAPDVAAEALGR